MEIIEPEEVVVEGLEEDEEQWTGSSEEEDTMEEELYECKVEVKTRETTIPTSVRTIESVGDVPGWAPITPYLNVSKSLPTSAAEEVAGITGRVVAGVVTSPESVMSCTEMITTPDSSISLQSQLSMAEVSIIQHYSRVYSFKRIFTHCHQKLLLMSVLCQLYHLRITSFPPGQVPLSTSPSSPRRPPSSPQPPQSGLRPRHPFLRLQGTPRT